MDSYYRSDVGSTLHEYSFLEKLPPRLRNKLLGNYLRKNIGKSFPNFFYKLGVNFSGKICSLMKYNKIGKEDLNNKKLFLIKARKVPEDIYFLTKGKLLLTSFNGEFTYSTLTSGDVFGEEYVLFDTPSSYNLIYDPYSKEMTEQDSNFIELYILSSKDFIDTLSDNLIDYYIISITLQPGNSLYLKKIESSIWELRRFNNIKNSKNLMKKLLYDLMFF